MANSKFSKKRYSNKHRQRKNSRKNMRGGSKSQLNTTTKKPHPGPGERAKLRHMQRYDFLKKENIVLKEDNRVLKEEIVEWENNAEWVYNQLETIEAENKQLKTILGLSTVTNDAALGLKRKKRKKKVSK